MALQRGNFAQRYRAPRELETSDVTLHLPALTSFLLHQYTDGVFMTKPDDSESFGKWYL